MAQHEEIQGFRVQVWVSGYVLELRTDQNQKIDLRGLAFVRLACPFGVCKCRGSEGFSRLESFGLQSIGPLQKPSKASLQPICAHAVIFPSA